MAAMPNPQNIGLITAAGLSQRMGFPKALLPYDQSKTFLEHMLDEFLQADFDIVVLTIPDDAQQLLPIVQKIQKSNQARLRIGNNPWPSLGMSGSIRWCLYNFSHANSLTFCPIDMPYVSSELLNRFILNFKQTKEALISLVQHQQKTGHPVGFSHHYFGDLIKAEGMGPKDVIKNNMNFVQVIDWHDERILCNINRPGDYMKIPSP